jgi:hypothetical protein
MAEWFLGMSLAELFGFRGLHAYHVCDDEPSPTAMTGGLIDG